MAKGVFVGVGGVAKKVKKIYVGVGGVPKKVKKAYVGVNGLPRLVYSSGLTLINSDVSSPPISRTLFGKGLLGHLAFFAGGTAYATGDAENTVQVIDMNTLVSTAPSSVLYTRVTNVAGASNSAYVGFDAGMHYSDPGAGTQMNFYNYALVRTSPDANRFFHRFTFSTPDYIVFAGGTSGNYYGYPPLEYTNTSLVRNNSMSLNESKFYGGSGQINGYGLCAGGIGGSKEKTSSVNCINLTNFASSNLTPLAAPKTGKIASANTKDYVVFFSGQDNGKQVDVFRKDLVKVAVADFPYILYRSFGFTADDIAVFGGGFSTDMLAPKDVMLSYDNNLVMSILDTTLPVGRYDAEALSYNGKAVIFGGKPSNQIKTIAYEY